MVDAGLVEELQDWARGGYCTEAAVGLLIGHRYWLMRADFVARIVFRFEGGRAMAGIEWADIPAWLDTVACSSSEASILRLACELVGVDVGVSLGQLLTGLDERNVALVVTAVTHATGHRVNSLAFSDAHGVRRQESWATKL